MHIGPGITVGGKYVLERPLARGGMGSVWVARHAKLGSTVAVKFLDAHLAASPTNVARFEREARAAATLDTPHVVHVHDYGVESGAPYLVMELLRGEDLSTRLRARGRLPLAEAGRILVQMSRALRRAHEAGIVHRDLKPANVFLARMEEEEEVVKVLDFGIAKETWARAEENTKTGEVFGSPHYMSPEQARAEKTLDHRADIWAVGVITYRMLTGKLPFPGEAVGEVLSHVLVDPFPPLSQVAPDLPLTLNGFFVRALAKKKQERFSSIGELIESFRTIIGDSTGRQSLSEIHAALRTLDPSTPLMPMSAPAPVSAPSRAAPPRPPATMTTAPTARVPCRAATPKPSAPVALAQKSAPAVATPPKLAPAANVPTAPVSPAPPKLAPAANTPTAPIAPVPPKPAPLANVPTAPVARAAPPKPAPGPVSVTLPNGVPATLPPATPAAVAPPGRVADAPPTRIATVTLQPALAAAGSASLAPPERPAPVVDTPPISAAPARPLPVASGAAAPRRTDSTAPTALFIRLNTPTAPLPPPPAPNRPSVTENTGPSLASTTSSVLPEQPRPPPLPRRLVGGLAACGLLVGAITLWATARSSTDAPDLAVPPVPSSQLTVAPVEPPPTTTDRPPTAATPLVPTAEAAPPAIQSPIGTEAPPTLSASATKVAVPSRTPPRKPAAPSRPNTTSTSKRPNIGW